MLKIRTGSPGPPEESASSSNGSVPQSSINDALDNLDEMKSNDQMSNLDFVKKDIEDTTRQARKNMSALDSLLAKTEKAEISLQSQNQQMKSILRK